MLPLDVIRKANKIIIYGAGSVSDLLYAFLCMESMKDKIGAFVVSDTNGMPDDKHGIPILKASEAVKHFNDILLLIAVHNKTVDQVIKSALSYGFTTPIVTRADDIRTELYDKLYKNPINSHKIFVSNYHGMGYGCNPKYLIEQILGDDTYKDFDIVWGIKSDSFNFPERVRTVQTGSYDYYKELATAKIWIDNVRKTDEVQKRVGQLYVQTWHGAAPFKKVEGDLVGKASPAVIDMGKRDSKMADLFVSGSRFYTKLYKTSFWYDGEILESGLPRHDVFWNIKKVREKTREYLGISEEKLMVLYSPTFRDDRNTNIYNIDISSIKKAIRNRFGRDSVFCVSKHPLNCYIDYSMDKNEYTDVGMYDDFEELLAAADILITDYSGCVYDFSFTGNPVFLYQPDLEEMLLKRDFYIRPDEMPYPSAADMDGLISNILSFNEKTFASDLKTFIDKFGNYDDGRASKRVLDRIMSLI